VINPATTANTPNSAMSSTRNSRMPSRLTEQVKSCNQRVEIASAPEEPSKNPENVMIRSPARERREIYVGMFSLSSRLGRP
jgi:hypothetical protein